MKKRNLTVKDKILIHILPFIAATLLVIFLLVYYQTRHTFMANYEIQKQQLESNIYNTLLAIDYGYAMLEKSLEGEMEQKLLEFRTEFENAGSDPGKISLDAMKAKLGGEYDLVIIDSDTTIIQSTIPGIPGINFKKASEKLGNGIDAIRNSDSVHYERFSANPGDGYLSAFAYLPTSDHRYLLEVTLTIPELDTYADKLNPLNLTPEPSTIKTEIVSIRVFDAYGQEYEEEGAKIASTQESTAIVEKAKKEKRFEVTDGHIVKSYFYVDLKKEGNYLSDNSKAVEIVYDTTRLMSELRRIASVIFLAGAAAMAILVVFITVLIKKVTYPITILTEAAKQISKGEYDIAAEKPSQDEIGELTDIFNSMTAKIKEDFEKIEFQKTELEKNSKDLEVMVSERTIELVRARETIKREKDVLESILNDTLSGYWDYDIEKRAIYYSSGFKRMLGFEDHELGNTYKDMKPFLFPEDREKIPEIFKAHLESNGRIPLYNEVRFKHRNGSTIWTIFTGHIIRWGVDGRPLEMIGCIINITEIKLLENSLNEERELLKATLLSMGDAVITTDKDGNVRIVNAVAEKLTGWTQEEASGKPFHEIIQFVNTATDEKDRDPLTRVLNTGEPVQDESELTIRSRKGREIPIEDSASPIKDENRNVSGAVFVFRDYTEKKERKAKIEYLSFHDQLTSLYNRRFFEEELKRLDTARNLPLSIIMLDVNGLKLINDAFGHAMGDLVLQRAAAIMKEECRRDDIVARFGGDEFVILLPRTGLKEAEKLVNRIYSSFETEIINNIIVSVSCGWAVKLEDSQSMANIFKLAEDHMYRRKLSESKSMHYKTIDLILKTLHGKSERERKHSERVGELCEAIAAAMNLDPQDVKEFRTIGLMHDIGKIAIDLSILDKPGEPDRDEWAEIQRHPELGYQILRSFNDFAKLAEYTLAHHERWDGTGYPRKLKGEDIPLEARIIAIADAFDSMTSDRAYRTAMDRSAAIEEIINGAGTQFDPDIVKIFVEKIYKTIDCL